MNENDASKEAEEYEGQTKKKELKIAAAAPVRDARTDKLYSVPGASALVGRKPIRTIVNDLQKKLLLLKSNPAAWDALQYRVDKYENPMKDQRDNLVRRNKETVANLAPLVKKENNLAKIQKHKDHQEMVLRAKRKIDKKKLEGKLALIKDKDIRLVALCKFNS